MFTTTYKRKVETKKKRKCINAQLGLDTLRGCHCQERLRHARSETRQRGAWARDFPLRIREEALVLVKGNESCSTFSPTRARISTHTTIIIPHF